MLNRPSSTINTNIRNDDSSSHDVRIPFAAPSPKASGIFTRAAGTRINHSTFTHFDGDQYNVSLGSETKERLATLEPVNFRKHFVQPCMEGTREKILAEIEIWLKDDGAPNILRLTGSPGSGKSTIASSLVSRLLRRSRLGSRIFFKQEDITLSDPASVWRTVAYDLAQYDPSFASILVEVLKGGTVDPGWPDITLHFESLIKRPLTERHKHSPPDIIPVIVIDALDECGYETSQEGQRMAFLNTLTQWSNLPAKFKLVVTGRDERLPQSLLSSCKEVELSTGARVSTDATSDIRHFFMQHFAEVQGDGWPGENVLSTLITRAAGLFIWAKTVVRVVVQQKQSLPDERLKLVLEGDMGEGDEVTELYHRILNLSFREADDCMLGVLNQLVTAIILAKIPLHVDDLCQLISQPRQSIDFILSNLTSVISIAGDRTIHIKHLSFTEFMCDPRRCPKPFHIDCARGKQGMIKACIKNAALISKPNIRELTLSNMTASITVPGHVSYACTYWIEHICEIKEDASSVSSLLETFLSRHLLHWLETMSILKLTRTTIKSLRCLLEWAELYLPDQGRLQGLLSDASRFVHLFIDIIEQHPLLVYLTALPFTPVNTLLFKEFSSENIPRIIHGYQRYWPLLLQLLPGHSNEVWSVAFNPQDGHIMASSSSDCSVRVWDTISGTLICPPLEAHKKAVNSVEFSPDGKMLISGSEDNTICLWDATSGTLIREACHEDSVRSVTFFPDGTRFASGSLDKSVRVWSVPLGKDILPPLRGHDDGIRTVVVSPDNKYIVSGSSDKTVRTWNAESGEGTLLTLCPDVIRCLAFSPNGSRLVAGSNNGTIYIWNRFPSPEALPLHNTEGAVYSLAFSRNGARLVASSLKNIFVLNVHTGEKDMPSIPADRKRVWAVTFSPDGKRIVSGSGDGVVRFWDATPPQMALEPLGADTKDIRCIQFSPDGHQVVSGSKDGVIYVRETATGNILSSSPGHTGSVNALAFSHDNKLISSGSYDRTILLWDAITYTRIPVTFRGAKGSKQSHRDSVLSLAFSPDNKRIVSGSADKTIRVWNAESGQMLLKPFQGHQRAIHSIAFSPDGTQILSGSGSGSESGSGPSDHTIRLWDSSSGVAQRIIRCPLYHGLSVTFSADGRNIKSSNDEHVIIWNSASGAEILRTKNHLSRSCGLDEPIELTRNGWIVKTSTNCTIGKLPPTVSVTKWTSSETTAAFTTSEAGIIIMHFPENPYTSLVAC